MAKIDQEKLEKFYSFRALIIDDYKNNQHKSEKFFESILWTFKHKGLFTSHKILQERQRSLKSLEQIKTQLSILRNMVENHVDIGKTLLYGKFENAHLNEMEKPIDFLKNIDEFEKWCIAAQKEFVPTKRGRKKSDFPNTMLIFLLEMAYLGTFGKFGSLSPGGFYLNATKETLEEFGIFLSEEGIKKKILVVRREFLKSMEHTKTMSNEEYFNGCLEGFKLMADIIKEVGLPE